jgi:GTPase
VVEADVIVHLRDISDPDTAAQADDVAAILGDLGIDAADGKRVIEVWNKVDLLDAPSRAGLSSMRARTGDLPITVSAVTGEGIDDLLLRLESHISGDTRQMIVTIGPEKASQIDWIYSNAVVKGRKDLEDGSVEFTLVTTEAAANEIAERLSGRKLR